MIGKHIIVKGRVQGVAFRYHCLQKALALGLTGFVNNRIDGDVFIEVCGDEDQVNRMIDWARYGSPAAEVNTLIITTVSPIDKTDGFIIKR